ncbi:MAG: peptide/nickel transport system ATP-binding protein [Alphaproteobacteria bacterium]|jgi:peptide/nickel transport system ATP-binding protein
MTAILEIDRMTVSYASTTGAYPVVASFSLSIAPGERVGLIGESGCGKSSVAMAIMRYLGRDGTLTSGVIRYQGADMAMMSPEVLRQTRGAGVGMIYQDPMTALNPSMTIGAQLIETQRAHETTSRKSVRAAAHTMLIDVRLDDPDGIMARYPYQLSGGQQQRVVIAMALLARPKLLVLDEPTTALDPSVEARIVDLILEVSEKHGVALLFISHDLALVRRVCDRVIVMYAGQAVEAGPAANVLYAPRHPYTDALSNCPPRRDENGAVHPPQSIPGQMPAPHERGVGCCFAPRCGFYQAGICDAPGAISALPATAQFDHETACARWTTIKFQKQKGAPARTRPDAPACRPPDTPVILQAHGVSKRYGSAHTTRALSDIDLTLRRGEILAIIGESGSGKTTLAKILAGLERADSGAVEYDSANIGAMRARARPVAIRRAMQMIFQNPDDSLNPRLTIGTQLRRAVKAFSPDLSRAQVAAESLILMDAVQLPHRYATAYSDALSGGQKQRVAIARAIAGIWRLKDGAAGNAVLIADEPLSALDVSVAAAIGQVFLELRRAQGLGAVFISHDLDFVRYLADSVMVLYDGHVVERGSAQSVLSAPRHPYTKTLLDGDAVGRLESASDPIPDTGCPFAPFCPDRMAAHCFKPPPLRALDDEGHEFACHLPVNTRDRVRT